MNNIQKWLTEKSELILQGHIFRYHKVARRSQDTDAKGEFDIVECLNWVNVVALDKDKNIVLVKQYRHGTDEITVETPGGAVSPGEDPLLAAKRELEEETGYISNNWVFLGESQVNPAFMTNKTFSYLALDCEDSGNQNFDDLEEIEIVLSPFTSIKDLIKKHEISHSIILTSFLFYQLYEKAE